ncbi:three component ABC system middle component [Sphingobacterium tabacisoli]|uniref:Three component ABC system middle component n=1 Tax=Sphingobacterium tabacisoli TaxID=2044855 RepID=A0ABW5L5N9_9SPHI|nr:three component ABC system middle component [Sphingobacterium tabacisoli]
MKIAKTENILFNPLFTARLISMALSGANNNEIKTELIYYILPLVYNNTIKDRLSKCNTRSTFNTFFDAEVRRELITIESLLANYKEKTKEALITISNLYTINISTHISLKIEQKTHYSEENNPELKKYYKAAFNLGSIFSKEDHKTIFLNL